MSTEAGLAAGYALLLVCVALGLDLAARHTHRRSERYRTAGFEYLNHLDAWRCPEGEFLRRVQLDHSARLVRYRAQAAVCNACPAKDDCTDSDQGREVARAIDPWPHSEAGRFHRGISVALLGLAALVCALGLIRNHAGPDITALGPMLLITLALALRMASAFLHTPANFPGGGTEEAQAGFSASSSSRARAPS